MHKIIARLGFREEDLLADARTLVISAIRHGNLAEYKSVWCMYQELAEIWIEALPDDNNAHAKAQIGLILAKAAIWREVHDRVRYWEELVDAETYAKQLGDSVGYVVQFVAPILSRGAKSHSFRAEYLQATKDFESAIGVYIEREQDECLTDWERGIVYLRLAECYRAQPRGMAMDSEEAQVLLEASIQSAPEYLMGSPEYFWALRILDELDELEAS